MAAPVSAEFLAAQARSTRHPKKEVFIVGRNVAAPTRGGSVSSSGDFSANFPAAGAIDGDRTHINYGAAADADNGKGLSGWKSDSAAEEAVWDTAAEFADHAIVDDFVNATARTGSYVQAHIRHNVFKESERFDQAIWIKTLCTIVPDAITAPDGTLTADRMVENAGAGLKFMRQNAQHTLNHDIPIAFFVQPDERTWLAIQVSIGAFGGLRLWFDIGNSVVGSSITVGPPGWTIVAGSARVTRVRNRPEWRRIEAIFRPTAGTAGTAAVFPILALGDLGAGYAGDGTSGLYLWGGQAADGGDAVPPYSRTQVAEQWFDVDDNFDALTAGIPLAPQAGWVLGVQTGAGGINVETFAKRGATGNGVHLTAQGPIAAQSNVTHPFTALQGFMVFETAVNMRNAGFGTDFFEFALQIGAVRLFSVYVEADAFLKVRVGAGAQTPVFNEKIVQLNTWTILKIVVDRTVPATSEVKVFYSEDGVEGHTEAWRDTIDTTGLDTVRLTINNLNPATPPAPDWWVDDLLIHTGHLPESTHAQVLDLGVVPSGLTGTLSIESEPIVVERLVDGAWYPTINRDPAGVPLGDVLGNTARIQTFTPATKQPITHVTFELATVGAPAGNCWVEILNTVAGVPIEDRLAKSLPKIPRVSMQPNVTRQRFEFPNPMVPDGVSTYAYRVMIDFPIDGVNYLAITDVAAGAYAGGQAFTWDGTTYVARAAADHPFVTWSNQIPFEQFDTGTEDTDLKINASASQHWLAMGFEVDREKDARFINISAKALIPHNIGTNGVEYWIDIHADDGSGTKPSNTILAIGVRMDPTVIAWAAYAWAAYRLLDRYKFVPGVKYWWALKATSNVLPGQPASNMLAFGADDSAPTYTRGNRAISNDANPKVWTAVPGGAMPFRIMEEERPYWALEASFSPDDLNYTDPIDVEGNGERDGSLEEDFTGIASRYWMARATAVCPGDERAFGPRITSFTEKVRFVTPKYITLDLGQTRAVDMVRIFGHPVTGGLLTFKISTSTDDILYTDIDGTGYRLETVESYAAGEVDDQGVTLPSPVTWEEDFESGYVVDTDLAGQQGWYKTAAHTGGAGNIMEPKAFGLHPPFLPASVDVSIQRFTPSSPLEYGKLHPTPENFAYQFEWWEQKGAANTGETTSLRFADGADSGADAWEVKWIHTGVGAANVTIVDAFGESATVFVADGAIKKMKIEVDADLTLRFYVRDPTPPEAYTLYYTGRAQRLSVDRTIIKAYFAVISFEDYDWFRFAEVVNPAALTIGGTYFGGHFLTTQNARYFRITVLDSQWEYAEILEGQAFRVIDVSDRVVSMIDSRSADFLQLRLKQKTIELVLQNEDRALSTRNSAGPWFGDLGGGAEIVAYVGYEGVADMVKTGVFYVDEWNEPARSAEITIGGTDGVKVLDTDQAPNYKQNFGYIEMIEYFANLANYPSQWVATDRAAGTIDFFADSKANSWDEIQKIGEAASFSRVWIDRNGRLRMRLNGTSAADLRLSTFLAGDEFRRTEGPPVFIGDKLYASVVVETDLGGGLQQQLKVVEYDLITKVWQYVAGGQAINTALLTEEQGFSTQVVFQGELYIFLHYQDIGTAGLRIVKWAGGYAAVPGAYEVMFERVDARFGVISRTAGLSAVRTIFPSVTLRNWFLTFTAEATDGFHYRFDLLTMQYVITFGVITIEGAVVVDDGEFGDNVYFSNTTGSGFPPTEGRWNWAFMIFESLGITPPSELKQMIFGNLSPFLHVGGRVFSMGTTIDENRNLITSLVGREGPSIPGRIWRQNIDTRAIDFSPSAYDPSFVTIVDNARDGLAIQWVDDMVISANARTGAHKELHLLQWDTNADEIVDAGNISLSNTRLITFVKRTLRGQNVLYGIADEGRIVEMYVRRKLPIQAAPIFEITDDTGGAFENASLQAGDDDGESRIVNLAIVKSEPLSVQPAEQVWKGSRLPWPVSIGTILDFGVNLREMALPFDAADAASQRLTLTDSGFTKTIALTSHHKRPKVTITFTGGPVNGGLVETIEINGDTLKKNETLIAYIFGNQDSVARWGIRQREIDNDYVYDSFAQSLVGASLVSRYQYERTRISGISIRALWQLEEFDLGLIRELNNLFINGNFYVVTISRQYHGAQVMTLSVEEGIV